MTTYTSLGERPLQHFYSIDIEEIDGSQTVFFNSTIHVEKRREVGRFSKSYKHDEILRDGSMIRRINMAYGKVTKSLDEDVPY